MSIETSTQANEEPAVMERDVDESGIQGPFFQEIGKRKMNNRDAKVLVTADNAETGVGKSNLCDFLAYVLDTTEAGFGEKKVFIEPEEFFEAYKHLEPGSATVLEEAEQIDSRRAMSTKNVESSHVWQKERVRQIIALLNLPSPKMIDKRMEELADYWINVEIRGRARIYKKKIHRIRQSVYYETMQVIHWPNMDGSQTFREMDRLKWDHIDGGSGGGWVSRDEMKETIKKRVREAKSTQRDEFIQSLYNDSILTAPDISELDAVDISPSRIRSIGNETTNN
jgi:hypothetical protein